MRQVMIEKSRRTSHEELNEVLLFDYCLPHDLQVTKLWRNNETIVLFA